ncbi:ABC transporter ATP-binding protein [Pseudofrankia sp. BMG5.36]|nr:ABC transporter ATP-binding protein [Pseudofrankia sp. BMG5.36]
MAGTPALEVKDLAAGYDRTEVLRGVSMQVPAGSVVALVGPNGGGKSTLLNTIAGLIRPTRGTISLYDSDITTLAPYRRTKMGLCHIGEGRAVFKRLTVRENLIMQAEKGREREAADLATTVFPRLGERMEQLAGTMSGGEQQMLAMARAYVRKPQLVLLDEPSLGLAPIVTDAIFQFLENELVAGRGVSVLVVDQLVHRVLDIAQHAFVLRRGELAFAGPSAELRASDLFAHYLSAGSAS